MRLWQCHPNFLTFLFSHWNMKMGWVWNKSVMTIMGLILLCRLKFRVWCPAHMGRLRSKIFFTSYQPPKRSHGTKFQQNPRNWGSACSYDLENLSVKKLDGVNMTYDNVCIQKLIFSSRLTILLLKTNFFKHKPTHLIFLPSNFSNKQKILQQKFFS